MKAIEINCTITYWKGVDATLKDASEALNETLTHSNICVPANLNIHSIKEIEITDEDGDFFPI